MTPRKHDLTALLALLCLVTACNSGRLQRAGLDRADARPDGPSDAAPADASPDEIDDPLDVASALALGATCSDGQQCTSGLCVDGVCCDSACTGICEACDGDLARGTCSPTIGPPRGSRPACIGSMGSTGSTGPCAGFCDGTSGQRCRYPGPETACADARCEKGVAAARALCSGTGQCVAAPAISCAPFTCDGPICAGGCTAARPCTPDNFCSGGRCFAKRENGTPCEGHDQCSNGACVDGRCCAQKSCGVCAACLGPQGTCTPVLNGADPDTCANTAMCGADGKCRATNGGPCGNGSECLSGFCAQGRCCNSACTGACQRCNLPGSFGTCSMIPLGADPKNCGACGNVCSSNHVSAVCTMGTCAGRCQAGFADCNGNLGGDGCEANLGDARNCRACGVVCPGTRCEAGGCEKLMLSWSSAGPIAGLVCIAIDEPSDPFTWNDNFLCTQRDFGLRWSAAGPIAGMTCTQLLEPSDPHTWNDNFLCAPADYGLQWSAAGPIAGMRCTQIIEIADPHTWTDNFLCAPP